MDRFKVTNESQSAHCCFGYTVVDTTKPDIIGGRQWTNRDGEPQFESVCECFDEDNARMIADALNAAVQS